MARRTFVSAMAALALTSTAARAAPADTGIVLMHGKWGSPQQMAGIASALEGAGYRTENIEMPWSGKRLYDKDYDEGLAEVDAAVRRLKSAGAQRIVVLGQSLGANAALAYAATRGAAVSALILLAPGHAPDLQQATFAQALARAQMLVNQGKGEETGEYVDTNSGNRTRTLTLRARTFVSYFDPAGLGAMTLTVTKVKPGIPVLMIEGESDPFAARAHTKIFDQLPPGPKNAFITLLGGHLDTPNVSAKPVLDWIAGLDA